MAAYERAVAADAKAIDMEDRLYWPTTHDEALIECVREDRARLLGAASAPPVYVDGYLGGHGYRLLVP